MIKLGRPALAAGALALLLGPAGALAGTPATSPNGQFVDLDVNVVPVAGAASGLDFHSFSGNRLGTPPESSSDIKLAFPSGSKYDGTKFPQCKVRTDPGAFSQCAKSTQIGVGTAEGQLTGADGKPTFVPVDLLAYNGTPVDGKPTVVFQGVGNGTTLAELDFTVDKPSSGPVFDDLVLPNAAPPSVYISKFDLVVANLVKTRKVKGKRRIVAALFTTPKSCPKKGWTFSQTNTTSSGKLTSTSTSPCVKLVKKG